ncbi:MAG: cyclic nucleotide-binding domain-containing protein [Desulfobacterales bacterium]|nr:cyclic nucleotide-binding domain-containing protein [Desulfobacterales bacterium]
MIESKYLKDNIQNIQKLMTLSALRHFETQNLAKLLKLSKIRQYDDGECIIQEGDLDPWLYIILEGQVKITKRGVEIAKIDKKGEFFGEMRIIDSKSRSASVYAVGTTICLAIDTVAKERSSEETMDERLDFLLMLYKVFAEYMSARLRLTNEEVMWAKLEIDRLRGK